MSVGDAAEFLAAMVDRGVVGFGDFVLKSGRRSPYFFDLGRVADGDGLALLGRAYATRMSRLPMAPEVLFGPAYKGIPIAVATAVAMAAAGRPVDVAFNRKEAKTHGEGGALVGAAMAGRRVVVVDDVVTDGAAKREAFAAIAGAGGEVVGVVLALDRQETTDGVTAVSALEAEHGVPVLSVATAQDLLALLADKAGRRGQGPHPGASALSHAATEFAVEHARLRDYLQAADDVRRPQPPDRGQGAVRRR